jgi:hypothetical protein
MHLSEILYILISIPLLIGAIYLIVFNSKEMKIYRESAKKLSQVPKSRKCTQKEKELLKKFYLINIKNEKVYSTAYVFLETIYSKEGEVRFVFNGARLISGLFFKYFHKIKTPKTFEYIVYKNNVYLVSVLFEGDNTVYDLNMEKKLLHEYDTDSGLKVGDKYILSGYKASFLTLFSTILFLILLNFLDIKVDAILYLLSMIYIYYSFIKDKAKTFSEYRNHNLTITVFTFINIVLLLITLYNNDVMKASVYSFLSKEERSINFQTDIDKNPLKVGQRIYLSGYRLCEDYACKKFTVLNKDLKFKRDLLIEDFFRNNDKIFFKRKKEKINILTGRSSALYVLNYKKTMDYLDKFEKYDIKSLDQLKSIIATIAKNKIVDDNIFIHSKTKDYYKYKDAFYDLKHDLLNLETKRLDKFQKDYLLTNAKTFFIRLYRDNNTSYKRRFSPYNYFVQISNFEESKRMNNIDGIVIEIKRKLGKEYVTIMTSLDKDFLIGNLIILAIIILNLLIFCFNLFIYIFYRKKKGSI